MKISNSGSQPVLAVPSVIPGESSTRNGTVSCESVRPRNSLVLLKMLFSKHFNGNILSDFERLLVLLSWENVISKAKLDTGFSGSYYREIMTLDKWITSLKKAPKSQISLTLDYQDYDLVYSEMSFKGFFNKLNNDLVERKRYFVEKRYHDQSVPKRELPLPRYIGVGYKDKGSSRIPHLDASPSWQELTMSLVISEFPGGKSGTNYISYTLQSVREVIFFIRSKAVEEFVWTRRAIHRGYFNE